MHPTNFQEQIKMKKATKILTLILVVVMVLSVFAGCDLVGKDIAKYRKATAITVGSQEITVGKLLDTFNSYYNNYYYYISLGYLTADQLMEMVVSSLYQQYAKIDNYVSTHDELSHSLANFCANAGYLKEEEMAFCIAYVKYISFQTFDTQVEESIAAKYELNDVEKEDKSRDFTEYEDLSGYASYAEYSYGQNFVNEDMDEYFEKYFDGVDLGNDGNLEVYANDVATQVRLAEYNDRIDGDEKLDLDELKKIQNNVLKRYASSVKSSYRIEMSEFIVNQIADLVASSIVAKYNFEVYRVLEGDNLANTLNQLKAHLQTLTDAQKAGFNINENFDSFITSLSTSSFIFDVPEDYATDYVFVKNILIPFSGSQSNILNNLASRLGSTERAEYIRVRNQFAAEVVADDFLSEKDEDGNYAKVENIFVLDDNGDLAINPDGALGQYFGANGEVTAMEGKSQDETIIELMKQYNTDIAQHTAAFDYVVRVNAPDDYKHAWVDEFVEGSKIAAELGTKHYALAVSSYGVHIIYVVDYVQPQQFQFDADNYLSDTSTPSYKLFTTYFSSQSSLLLEESVEQLQKDYASKVTTNKVFNKFLKENGFKFDIESFLADLVAED